jgi:hypothetical protein
MLCDRNDALFREKDLYQRNRGIISLPSPSLKLSFISTFTPCIIVSLLDVAHLWRKFTQVTLNFCYKKNMTTEHLFMFLYWFMIPWEYQTKHTEGYKRHRLE